MVLVVKNPPANAGTTGSIPGFGKIPGGGNGNLLQYSGGSIGTPVFSPRESYGQKNLVVCSP